MAANKQHLRLTLRQEGNARLGRKQAVLNDSLEVIDDETGEVIADLSHFLQKSTIIRGVGEAHRWQLDLLAGEVVATDEGKDDA